MRLSYLGLEGKVRQLPYMEAEGKVRLPYKEVKDIYVRLPYMEVEGKVRLPYLNVKNKVTLPYNEAMVCSLHFIYKYGGLDCHVR